MFTLSTSVVRILVSTSHFLTWISSAIVVGITGYFLDGFPHDQHLTFEIIISALVLGLWLPSFIVPFLGQYKPYYLPLNFIFSYLWLTAFVFSAQDYNESSCWGNAPTGGRCTLKLSSEAFIFIAFFFTLVAFLVEIFALKCATESSSHAQKDTRPSVESSAA